jgi:cytochrome P450
VRQCRGCGSALSKRSQKVYCGNACQASVRRKSSTERWLDSGEAWIGTRRGHYIREYLADAQSGCCAVCGGASSWLGLPLALVLDHIDGNPTNNRRENLRLVCPNIRELVVRKEHAPCDDLISRLATDYVATGQLNRETAAMIGAVMMQAGHETTANMIALGTVALLQHRDVFERLGRTDDQSVVANIVEELMRYLTIVHSQVDRVAIDDLTIAGQTIRAGDFLVMNLPAGNWDPEFAENPEEFDINRNTRGHLGFGYGVHQCIGQNLARVEMQIAFATLARRLPGLRLAVSPDALRFKGESGIYGMKELPVTW